MDSDLTTISTSNVSHLADLTCTDFTANEANLGEVPTQLAPTDAVPDGTLCQVGPVSLVSPESSISETPAIADLNPGLQAPKAAVPGGRSREEMLKLIDQIVELFNNNNFESLSNLLAVTSVENVNVRTQLDPEPIREGGMNPAVGLANYVGISPMELSGVPSILLTWLLLSSAHPDGAITVVDRRICYRRVLKASTTATTGAPTVTRSGNARTVTPARHNGAPVTIIETVLKLTGSCVVTRSLQALLHTAVSVGDAFVGPVFDTVPTGEKSSSSSSSSSSSGIQRTVRHEDLRALVNRVLAEASPTSEISSPVVGTPSDGSESLHSHTENRRQYLFEWRVQFDQHDRLTHWNTTVLAYEPEESSSVEWDSE
jgi:hypothetical protein